MSSTSRANAQTLLCIGMSTASSPLESLATYQAATCVALGSHGDSSRSESEPLHVSRRLCAAPLSRCRRYLVSPVIHILCIACFLSHVTSRLVVPLPPTQQPFALITVMSPVIALCTCVPAGPPALSTHMNGRGCLSVIDKFVNDAAQH